MKVIHAWKPCFVCRSAIFLPPLKLGYVSDGYISLKCLTPVVVPQRGEIRTTAGNSRVSPNATINLTLHF